MIETLKDAESVEIGHTDYYVFDTYLFPAFLKLLDDPEPQIHLKFIEILPFIVNIGKMLITSVNLHKQRITMLAKDELFEVEIDQTQREMALFSHLKDPIYKDTSYKFQLSPPTEASENPQEESEQAKEDSSEEEEMIADTKAEAIVQAEKDREMRMLAQSVREEAAAPINW